MQLRILMSAFALLGGWSGVVQAQSEVKKPESRPAATKAAAPLDRAELDKRAARAAYNAAKLGSKLWENNQEATYRLYQGALMALQPMLDHRPKLAEYVGYCLEDALSVKPEKGAFILRDALDAIMKDCSRAAASDPSGKPRKANLWTRLGGEKAVKAFVHDTVASARKDPKVNLDRGGKYKLDDKRIAALEEHLVELISEIGRGPLTYSGRDVGRTHRPMKITDGEFEAFVGHFADALKKNKVPQADAAELLKIVSSVKPLIVAKGK